MRELWRPWEATGIKNERNTRSNPKIFHWLLERKRCWQQKASGRLLWRIPSSILSEPLSFQTNLVFTLKYPEVWWGNPDDHCGCSGLLCTICMLYSADAASPSSRLSVSQSVPASPGPARPSSSLGLWIRLRVASSHKDGALRAELPAGRLHQPGRGLTDQHWVRSLHVYRQYLSVFVMCSYEMLSFCNQSHETNWQTSASVCHLYSHIHSLSALLPQRPAQSGRHPRWTPKENPLLHPDAQDTQSPAHPPLLTNHSPALWDCLRMTLSPPPSFYWPQNATNLPFWPIRGQWWDHASWWSDQSEASGELWHQQLLQNVLCDLHHVWLRCNRTPPTLLIWPIRAEVNWAPGWSNAQKNRSSSWLTRSFFIPLQTLDSLTGQSASSTVRMYEDAFLLYFHRFFWTLRCWFCSLAHSIANKLLSLHGSTAGVGSWPCPSHSDTRLVLGRSDLVFQIEIVKHSVDLKASKTGAGWGPDSLPGFCWPSEQGGCFRCVLSHFTRVTTNLHRISCCYGCRESRSGSLVRNRERRCEPMCPSGMSAPWISVYTPAGLFWDFVRSSWGQFKECWNH